MAIPKVLFIDIETRLMKVYSFGIWQQTIRPEQIIDDWNILSFSVSWLGEDKIHYFDLKNKDISKDKPLAKKIRDFMDQADILVAHNGDGFDIPRIMERILCYKIKRPTPFKTIDTKKLIKKHFGFTSNSLAYACKRLGIAQKLKHKEFPGLELWIALENKNKRAWKEMEAYNRQDVVCLKALLMRIQPYCRIPALDVHDMKQCVCGSKVFRKNGKSIAGASIIQRYQCTKCLAPYQTSSALPKEERSKIMRKM